MIPERILLHVPFPHTQDIAFCQYHYTYNNIQFRFYISRPIQLSTYFHSSASESYLDRVYLPLPLHFVHVTLHWPLHFGHVVLCSVCGHCFVIVPPWNGNGEEIGYSQSFGIGPNSSVSIYQVIVKSLLRYHCIPIGSVIVKDWAFLRVNIPSAQIAIPHGALILNYNDDNALQSLFPFLLLLSSASNSFYCYTV